VSAVSKGDFLSILLIAIVVVTVIFLFYKELITLSFDEEHATVSGIHAKRIHFLFIVLTALIIAASIRIVCVLFVSALMTLPVTSALRFANSFNQLILYSFFFGEISVVLGLICGYYLSIQPGGMIVLIAVIILLIALYLKRMRLRSKKERSI